ncbi:MAG: acyl-CoA/acyl-ACP dehydrogenase [Sphingomonadaceae bacterium]|uniref:acyl-CoA dehydrogenase family protein n=1 Tax=Thermaurantiacus sp. TaxID=2820283 RepID=UPI00298F1136|nr:acyl-CoA dehydrogenase family protein [Thermaurantiacus sp.]MCS6987484.1 acyl-CoA/acyl-ACP dehydrogenase [Sphingomonadaceae bacterium]MDW8415404.1 acyl-CoA dehydrogenase family protein [Thermaurantiacus sp.]
MDFGLSPEQRMFQESLGRHLAEASPLEVVRQARQPSFDPNRLVPGLAALGVAGLLVPEAHGGLGLGVLDAALAAEMLGRAAAPAPFVAAFVMAPLALALAGSPEQQAALLPKIAEGRLRVGAAFAEQVAARADAGVEVVQGRLSGRALFVLDFAADAYLVASRDGGLWWVEAGASGLERIPFSTIDTTRRVGELRLAATPAEPLPGASPAVLRRIIDAGRVVLAGDTLGAAQHMLEAAVDYAKTREQFGRPIGSFQAVKHMCAEMAASLEPCRAFLWYAAHAQDALPEEAALQAAHLKAHVAEVGTRLAKTATEVHGGMGFTDLLGLHHWFKRIAWNRQMLGSPEQCRREAARLRGLAA